MNLSRALLFSLSVLLALCIFPASAADGDQAYLVMFVKFKPGKKPDAFKIIREHFVPVDQKIGRRPFGFEFATGEWDQIVYFPYDTAQMDTIPSRAIWWKALAEQEGGTEQAQKLFQSFLDLYDVSKFEIAKPFAQK